MATSTINPYPLIGTQLKGGLDFIPTVVTPAAPTVDELADAIFTYVQPIYYPVAGGGTAPTQIEIEIRSVVFNIINAYNNKLISQDMFSNQQKVLVNMMLGQRTTENTPINALDSWLTDIQDNISDAGLDIEKQTPLLLGIEVGKTIYEYWVDKVATPADWGPFFQTAAPANFANIPFWLAAAMEGALLGASGTEKGLIAPTTDIVSVEIISALIGGLAIGAGKVIFKWVPRIQPTQLTGGFKGIIGPGDDVPPAEGSNDLCTNKKCTNAECVNTCVNQGCNVQCV